MTKHFVSRLFPKKKDANSKDAKEDEDDVGSKPGIDRLLININLIKLNNKILFLHFKCSHFKFIKLKQ